VAAPSETAALIALLRRARREPEEYSELVESRTSALAVLREETTRDGHQLSLLTAGPGPTLDDAQADLNRWAARGLTVLTVLDDDYPANLRHVYDRPPLLFIRGALRSADERAIAVIGSRRASAEGLAMARTMATELTRSGFTVVSGLAAGIDTAAHASVLAAGGRTIAVIGTGLDHTYPRENARLQREIAERGAVVSQFWPDTPPSRLTFPMRNAAMSGLTLGTVIIEASVRSGARIQARRALAHGRPVFLLRSLLGQPWADELAARPGVHVVEEVAQIVQTVERLNATDVLVE
jgi:DNA processing protein